MDKQEQDQELVQEIKELMQSKGWRIYQDLLGRWLEGKEKVKANFLRQLDPNKATYIQGQIDGYIDFTNSLNQYLESLINPSNEEKPA